MSVCSYQRLHIAPPALVLFLVEFPPLAQHLGIRFQLRTCFCIHNAVPDATLHDMIDDNGVHSFAAQFRPDCDQKQIHGRILM